MQNSVLAVWKNAGEMLWEGKDPCCWAMRRCHVVLDEELEISVTQLVVPGTEGGLTAEQGLLGRARGYLSHGLLFLFLRYSTPGPQRGEGRTVCVCGCFKELWDFNEDIKSLLLSLYNS